MWWGLRPPLCIVAWLNWTNQSSAHEWWVLMGVPHRGRNTETNTRPSTPWYSVLPLDHDNLRYYLLLEQFNVDMYIIYKGTHNDINVKSTHTLAPAYGYWRRYNSERLVWDTKTHDGMWAWTWNDALKIESKVNSWRGFNVNQRDLRFNYLLLAVSNVM